MLHKFVPYQDHEIPPPPSFHCKEFKKAFLDKPTPNFEYSLLYIKNIVHENIPAKLSRFYDFCVHNNLESSLESECLGK